MKSCTAQILQEYRRDGSGLWCYWRKSKGPSGWASGEELEDWVDGWTAKEIWGTDSVPFITEKPASNNQFHLYYI